MWSTARNSFASKGAGTSAGVRYLSFLCATLSALPGAGRFRSEGATFVPERNGISPQVRYRCDRNCPPWSRRIQGRRQNRMKLKIRQNPIVHFKVRSCSRPGLRLFGKDRSQVHLPVAIFHWLGVIGDVGRSCACHNWKAQNEQAKQES